MKKIILFFFSIFLVSTGFSENFVLNNQTSNPTDHQKSNIAIQWATSAKDIDANKHLAQQGLKLNPKTLKFLTQTGKITLDSPKKAEYFRVIVWSKSTGYPDFFTNWVDIVPNKTYTLNKAHLIPAALMSGTGC